MLSLGNGDLQSRAPGREGRSRSLLAQPISERNSNHLGSEQLPAAQRNTGSPPRFGTGWLSAPRARNVGLLQPFHQALSLN